MARRKKRSRVFAYLTVLVLAATVMGAVIVVEKRAGRGKLDDRLWTAIATVETGRNPLAVNPEEGAVGIVQIRETCLDDCNRIARLQGLPVQFAPADRFDPAKSRQMWKLYLSYYGQEYEQTTGWPPTNEVFARIWNGGPTGWRKESTADYWDRVREAMPGPAVLDMGPEKPADGTP